MSIIGGSLIGTITTRLPPAGGTVPAVTYDNNSFFPACVGGSIAQAPSVGLPDGPTAATFMMPMSMPSAPGPAQAISVQTPHTGEAATLKVPCLTAGMPTPDAIATKKEEYARNLEHELRNGVQLLGKVHKQKTDELHTKADQGKHQYNLVLDQQVKQQEMYLSQQYNEQLMILQQAAQQQRAELEQQAAALILEWQQRQTQVEFVKEQQGIQKRFAQVQQEIASEMEKVGIAPCSGAPVTFGGACQSTSEAVLSNAILPVHAASRPLNGSVNLNVGSVSIPVRAPIAKYAVPSSLTGANAAMPARRVQYVPPGGAAVGSVTLPSGQNPVLSGSASSRDPIVYSASSRPPSRASSYVPPRLNASQSTPSGAQVRSASYAPGSRSGTSRGINIVSSSGSAVLPVGPSTPITRTAAVHSRPSTPTTRHAASAELPFLGARNTSSTTDAGVGSAPSVGSVQAALAQAMAAQAAAAQAAATVAFMTSGGQGTTSSAALDPSVPPAPLRKGATLPARGG